MKAIIFGPPASGKGTYASIIGKELGIIKISTGDMIREEEKAGTILGKMMKEYTVKGELVPDKIVIKILKTRISRPDCKKKGFILDGYPRTVNQAKVLEGITPIDVIIYLNVPDEVIIERIINRRVCSNRKNIQKGKKKTCDASYNLKSNPPKVPGICDECGSELYQRPDDTREAVENRLRVYRKATEPLLDYYRGKVAFVEFTPEDPDAPPEVNAGKILVELKKLGFYK